MSLHKERNLKFFSVCNHSLFITSKHDLYISQTRSYLFRDFYVELTRFRVLCYVGFFSIYLSLLSLPSSICANIIHFFKYTKARAISLSDSHVWTTTDRLPVWTLLWIIIVIIIITIITIYCSRPFDPKQITCFHFSTSF